ncbi:UNVERIFIED_CONTAM: SRS domain protein, partial [Hammondia hammondi]
MAVAHSAAACRYSTFRPALLQERRSGHSSVSFVYSSQLLSLSLLALLAASFVQLSVGNPVDSQSILTCDSDVSLVALQITSKTTEVKFKCGTGLQLRKNPTDSNKLWGNAACTKEVDASSVTFTSSSESSSQEQHSNAKQVPNRGTEYSLKPKNETLPMAPFTVYFSCDPASTTGGGERGKARTSGTPKPCVVQVSVFSQKAVTVPETNKCKDSLVTLAITS